MSIKGDVLPQYLGGGDPALTGYYPKWVDSLADDAILEGSMLDGAVQGEAVRSIVLAIRSLYDRQAHKNREVVVQSGRPAGELPGMSI